MKRIITFLALSLAFASAQGETVIDSIIKNNKLCNERFSLPSNKVHSPLKSDSEQIFIDSTYYYDYTLNNNVLDSVLSFKVLNKYDKNGNLIFVNKFSADYQTNKLEILLQEFLYYTNSKLTSQEHFRWEKTTNLWENHYKEETKYDEKGNIISFCRNSSYDEQSGIWIQSQKEEYAFDKYNHQIYYLKLDWDRYDKHYDTIDLQKRVYYDEKKMDSTIYIYPLETRRAIKTIYDKNGNATEGKYYEAWSDIENDYLVKKTAHFNVTGDVISISTQCDLNYDRNYDDIEYVRYTYDSHRNIDSTITRHFILGVWYNRESIIKTNEYDDKNRIISSTIDNRYNDKRVYWHKYEYTYDDDSNIELSNAEFEWTNDSWTNKIKNERVLDNKNRLIENNYFEWNESGTQLQRYHHCLYIYDNNDSITTETHKWIEYKDNKASTSESKLVYQRNAQNNRISYNCYEKIGTDFEWLNFDRIINEYDTLGNLLSHTTFKQDTTAKRLVKSRKIVNYYSKHDSTYSFPSPINTISHSSAIMLYPNPTNTDITIKIPSSQTASAHIYNTTGQLQQTIALTQSETTVSGLETGLYLIEICINGSCETQRLVVKR